MTAEGHFVEGLLTGGNVHDVTVADELFADVVGFYVVEDAGYDSDPHRRQLRSNNNIPVIPGRKNRKIPIEYDKKIYALRKPIEMFFGKLKENKLYKNNIIIKKTNHYFFKDLPRGKT